MHHSTKDHHLFGCTKHIIKLELWFVCVKEHTLYGYFQKLSTKNGVKIFLSWCQLSNNCNYVQEHLEMVLMVLLSHKVKNHIFYKCSSCVPTFPSFLFMFWEFGVCLLCFASLCWIFKKIWQVFLNKRNSGFKVLTTSLGLHWGLHDKPIVATIGLQV
jgi:hypothetical protein